MLSMDRTLSFVLMRAAFVLPLHYNKLIYKAQRWYGGDLYNSSVDSLPPGKVEQDLACLLPRKPKFSWLCSQVLDNDELSVALMVILIRILILIVIKMFPAGHKIITFINKK